MIEQLKAKLAQQSTTQAKYRESYLNLVLEGRQQLAHAFASLLQGIQLLRDRIRNFIEQPESYDRDVIYKEILEQAEAIVTVYSANQLQLGEAGRAVGHNVKNLAIEIASRFERLRKQTKQSPNSPTMCMI